MPDRPPIPFNRPSLEGQEIAYIRQAVENGHTSSSGPFAAKAAELLRDAHQVRDVLLTTSCTAALEMAAMLLEVERDRTVIVPSFTFVTSALAFARQGARLLFCDIEPVTLGPDPDHVAELLDESVSAVVAVHYAGVAGDLPGLAPALSRWGADLVEDNAHGTFGSLDGRPLGSFGRFSTFSFHETKNFVCGEGGALALNDPADVDRAHVLFDKGTNRRAFLGGQVDKYSWQDTGSSFGLSEVLAAYLYAQLEVRDAILAKRQQVFDRYEQWLAPHAEEKGFRTPVIPPGREQTHHMYYVLLEDKTTRDRVLAALREQDIHATFHYIPLHSSAGAQRFLARPTDCPVSIDVSGRLLRLPFYNDLGADDAERVVEAFLGAL